MASARTATALITLAGLGAALILALGAGSPTNADAATASSCTSFTLSPASGAVRRGGKVALEGEAACGGAFSSSAPTPVRVQLRKGKRWATVASAETLSDGSFSACAKVGVPRRTKVAKLRVRSPTGATGATRVRISKRGVNGCDVQSSSADDPPSYQPPPADSGNPDCPLSQPGSTIGMTLPSSCTVVSSDTASSADPTPTWGKIDCANSSRHQQIGSGGDGHLTGHGAPQGNSSYRRMTVVDGDDIWGERCELGLNRSDGPTTLYHEGQRRVTFISIRLPNGTDVNGSSWRTVMQMKQAQTYRNPDLSPILEMQVVAGRWFVNSSWDDKWDTPAQQNTWTRFAFDITYSQNPSVGRLKAYVDLNGDGDASDANEQSPAMQMATLRAETAGTGASDFSVGQSIPDHLRAGIYHDQGYSCPSGCSVDIDNVQVVKP